MVPKTYGAFLKAFNEKHREKFNENLFRRSDDDVVRELSNVIYNLNRDTPFYTIEVRGITKIDNYEECQQKLMQNEIDRIKSSTSRAKIEKEIRDKYARIVLKDTDFFLLVINYHIVLKQEDPATGKYQEEDLEVLWKVPRYVDKYYYRIQGNNYVQVSQIVDGSTYNNTGAVAKHENVTMKVMYMATRVYKMDTNIKVTNPEGKIKCHFYNSKIFSKWVPITLYLFAHWGMYTTMCNLHLNGLIEVGWDEKPEETHWNVKAGNIIISVPKGLYEQNVVLQTLVYTIQSSIKRTDRPEDLRNVEFWLKALGASYAVETIDKGVEILASLSTIYDKSTQETLKLIPSHKEDIYQILTWVICEFDALRQKDNMDLAYKRKRSAELTAALVAGQKTKNMYRISNGRGIDMPMIIKALRDDPNILIKRITKDKLFNYQNICNDMDVWDALKFTYGGLTGIGVSDNGETSATVPMSCRSIHPSYIYRLDQAYSVATNPGMTGLIVPFCDMDERGLFSPKAEPDSWRRHTDLMIRRYYHGDEVPDVFPFAWCTPDGLSDKEEADFRWNE